ncbi:hypothetical protein FVEG_09673 [Fusarium verticillioides 7600]|uniref:Uncharacterized protein n=1 Tax=Gibberella moniliformis (strain M3125 / FGSC 7600) TaxID=334819 RepID=W7MFQ4_GIBM7|nr:hypothetical protein FVEG_09673 [Fusarium verticillioides 7600]EWG50463.1 hypothetical protein FVEG_09673 [Fusarium verticillioides 7600]
MALELPQSTMSDFWIWFIYSLKYSCAWDSRCVSRRKSSLKLSKPAKRNSHFQLRLVAVKDFTVIFSQTPFADSLPPLGDCAEVMKVEHIDPRKRPYGTRSYRSPYMERHSRNSGKSDGISALRISLLGMMGKPAYCRSQKAAEKEIEALQAAFVEIYEIHARRSTSALVCLVQSQRVLGTRTLWSHMLATRSSTYTRRSSTSTMGKTSQTGQTYRIERTAT